MSVVIKDFEMPWKCSECVFAGRSTEKILNEDYNLTGFKTTLICQLNEEIKQCPFTKRHKDCPLIYIEEEEAWDD